MKYRLTFTDGRTLDVHADTESAVREHGGHHETERIVRERALNHANGAPFSAVADVALAPVAEG